MATKSELVIVSTCYRQSLDALHRLLEMKSIVIPSCQRPINGPWTIKMAQSYLRDFVNNGFIVIPGLFQLCQLDGKVQILDGQHRYEAYKYCLQLNSDPVQRMAWFRQLLGDEACLKLDIDGFIDVLKKLPVDIKVYTITEEAHAKFLFDRINTQLPVEVIMSSTDDIVRATINKLRNAFPKSNTIITGSRGDRTKINYDILEQKLRGSKIVEVYDLKTSNQLYVMIMRVNAVFASTPLEKKEDFAAFPSAKATTTYPTKWRECHATGLMLGLYPNYEWVDELVEKGSFHLMRYFPTGYTALKTYFTT